MFKQDKPISTNRHLFTINLVTPFISFIQFQANTGVGAKNVTLKDTWAHFIRIHPESRNGKWKCMRLALYGCQTGSLA